MRLTNGQDHKYCPLPDMRLTNGQGSNVCDALSNGRTSLFYKRILQYCRHSFIFYQMNIIRIFQIIN